MVAKISFPKKMLAALSYNECKCTKGSATCIAAVNYLPEAEEMNFYQKRLQLDLRNELNERTVNKTIHISLNFDPSEKIKDPVLKKIAISYMQLIGFGDQPVLVYKHNDAAHPHIHLLSTTIRDDGTRIRTYDNIRNMAEKARKEIEAVFGLIKAGEQKESKQLFSTVHPEKIIYGKTEVKRSLDTVVSEVFHHYRYSSLSEFNAALHQFNVLADRGKENGRMFKNRGLLFRVLDEKGNKVGVPIKASTICCKPTLQNLETRFSVNDNLKQPIKERTRDAINGALKLSGTINTLKEQLQKQHIYIHLRQKNEQEITFVDNEAKVVFSESELVLEFGAMAQLLKFKEKEAHGKEVSSRGPQTLSVANGERQRMVTDSPSTAESVHEESLSAQAGNSSFPLLSKKRERKTKQPVNARTV